MPSQSSYADHRSNNIIHCAPNISTYNPFSNQFASIKSLSSRQKSFFHQFCKSINSNPNITNILSNKIQSNVSIDEDELRESEIRSITSGFGQFIADAFFECVTRYNWSTDNFMEQSKLFSEMTTDSELYKLIRAYLKNYLRFITKPIQEMQQMIQSNQDIDDIDIDVDIDDDEYDTLESRNAITYKHNMRRILYYISQFKFSLPNTPARYHRKQLRQIDTIFIPKSDIITGELLRSNGIEYEEIDQNKLQANLRRKIGNLSKYDLFSRFVLLIVGDDNTNIGAEKIYLFKVPTDDESTHFLNDTELTWIYNTRNNPQWLKNIIHQSNGITFSYHMHSKNVQRVYLSYETSDNQYYSTRVFKHNVADILKIFCDDIDINDIKFDKTEFKDIEYTDFVNKYFSDLKLLQYDNYYRMNELMKEYYKTMGVMYDNNFINYMNEHGFSSDEQLEDILGKDVTDYNDCTIVEFDKQFPIQKTAFSTTVARNDENRNCFIFHFLKHCYLNNTIPTQKDIIHKYYNIGVSCLENTINHSNHFTNMTDPVEENTTTTKRNIANHIGSDIVYPYKSVSEFVPGGYCYEPEHGEGAVEIMVFSGSNSASNHSSNTNNSANGNNNGSQGNNDQNNNSDGHEGDDGGGGGNGDFNGGYDGNDEDKNKDEDKKGEVPKDNEEKQQKNEDPKTLYLIARKFTDKIIPRMTREKIKDYYHFLIDKLRLLSVNNGIYELRNGDRVVNCGFHHKHTGEILYAYAKTLDSETNRGYKWKFENKLYTKTEMMRKKGVPATKLPRALVLNNSNKTDLTQEIIKTRIDLTRWAKINVYNINNKESNKCKLTLALTVEQFKKNINKYNNLTAIDTSNLIPIVSFDDVYNKYWLEYVLIVRIKEDVEIGISFKYESKGKVKIRGIYLDKQLLLRQHMLAAPDHDCHCLDNKLISNITSLEIGNVNTKENKIKDWKKRYEILEQKYNALLTQTKKINWKDNSISQQKNSELNRQQQLSKGKTPKYEVVITSTKQNQRQTTNDILEPLTFPTTTLKSNESMNDTLTTNRVSQSLSDLTMEQSISAPTPITLNASTISSQTSTSINSSFQVSQPLNQTPQFPQQIANILNSYDNINNISATISNMSTPGLIWPLSNIYMPFPQPILYNPLVPFQPWPNVYFPPPPYTFSINIPNANIKV